MRASGGLGRSWDDATTRLVLFSLSFGSGSGESGHFSGAEAVGSGLVGDGIVWGRGKGYRGRDVIVRRGRSEDDDKNKREEMVGDVGVELRLCSLLSHTPQ